MKVGNYRKASCYDCVLYGFLETAVHTVYLELHNTSYMYYCIILHFFVYVYCFHFSVEFKLYNYEEIIL